MLTFEQFVASKAFFEHGFLQMEIEGPAWIYDLNCHIFVMQDGSFLLIIENRQWVDSDISVLERILYDQFYVTECN